MDASSLRNGAVTVGAVPTKILDAGARAGAMVQNLSLVDIWIGGPTVAVNQGIKIKPDADISVPGQSAVYGVVSTGTAMATYLEAP
jgi:hypothetical protein